MTIDEDKYLMIVKSALKVPGVYIKREDFLRKELSMYFSSDTVNVAVDKSPAKAGISIDQLEIIADSCINYETNKVSLISAAAGVPGGFGLFATVPADAAQYFAHIIRIVQKLMYLYGWEELYNPSEEVNDETLNMITIFVGVMFGVKVANDVINKLSKIVANQIEKNLVKKALTKGFIYPIVKQICKMIGIKMSKQLFAKTVSKVIPLAGGVLSGGLTYATFKPSAKCLKDKLKELYTADVNFNETTDDIDVIDVEFENI